MNWEKFRESLKSLGLDLSEENQQAFTNYMHLIQRENQKINLTSIVDDEEIIEKHFYDSLLLAPYLKENETLLDVGSGAGFPGLPLAIMRQDLSITLLEPTKKKTRFLELVVKELFLDNVKVIDERAEDYVKDHREQFTYVTARAVANLPMLVELTLPLTKVGGTMFALKSRDGVFELNSAKKAIKILGGVVGEVYQLNLISGDSRTIIEIKKVKETPSKYPRLYAQIKKTPL